VCKKIFVLLLVFLLSSFITLSAKTYKVYYLGGQSNAEGQGRIADLPAELQGPVKGVMIYQGNTGLDGTPVDGRGLWTELKPGHGGGFRSDGVTNKYGNKIGLELSFARRMLELDSTANIAIIKYARGGSSIDSLATGQWGCWEPDYRQKGGINQYDHFLATLRNAFAVADIDGDGETDTLIPAGILWMQGESDSAFSEEIARRYEAHLKRLMDLIRAALRRDDLPVIIGRISDSGKNGRNVWKYCDIVRQCQADYVAHDGYAALATGTDNYGYSDPYHYNAQGYIDMGKEFAEKLFVLQQKF